jgi:hypothetical protein
VFVPAGQQPECGLGGRPRLGGVDEQDLVGITHDDIVPLGGGRRDAEVAPRHVNLTEITLLPTGQAI